MERTARNGEETGEGEMKDGIGTERTIGKLPRNGGGEKERDLTR